MLDICGWIVIPIYPAHMCGFEHDDDDDDEEEEEEEEKSTETWVISSIYTSCRHT